MGNLLTALISFFPFLNYLQPEIEDEEKIKPNQNSKDEGQISVISDQNRLVEPVSELLPGLPASETNTRNPVETELEPSQDLENTLELMTRGTESRIINDESSGLNSEGDDEGKNDDGTIDQEIHSIYSNDNDQISKQSDEDLNETFELMKTDVNLVLSQDDLVKPPETIILETRNSVEITSLPYTDDRAVMDILTNQTISENSLPDRERFSMQVNISSEATPEKVTSEKQSENIANNNETTNLSTEDLIETSSDSIKVILNLKNKTTTINPNDSGLTDTCNKDEINEKADIIVEDIIEKASLEVVKSNRPKVSFVEVDGSDSGGDNTQEEELDEEKEEDSEFQGMAKSIVENAIDCGVAEVQQN